MLMGVAPDAQMKVRLPASRSILSSWSLEASFNPVLATDTDCDYYAVVLIITRLFTEDLPQSILQVSYGDLVNFNIVLYVSLAISIFSVMKGIMTMGQTGYTQMLSRGELQ